MNKYILSLLCLLAVSLSALAQQFNGNGYYRIQNNYTERYCYLLDNWVYVDVTASKVTLSAIELWKDIERAQSDPATVLYIKQVNSKYDIEAQGASLYSLADAYLSLRYDAGRDASLAYGSYSGLTKYLTDNNPSLTEERSWMCDTRYNENSYWRLLPISNSGDNFFGIKPTVTAGNKHYASMYCDFPFEAASDMTIYYVATVDAKRGLAIYKPIEGGKVAAKTPMIIECGSANVSGNKVNIGVDGAKSAADNKLKGVFFNINNYYHPHKNQTKYDANTMRLLGTTSSGEVGFVTSSEEYVPRNSAYLSVPANSPAEFKLVTQAEYDYIIEHEVIEAASVTLSQTALSLQPGQSATLKATVAPDNTTDKTVTWTSSNTAVATVDASGKVAAVSVGKATITATCGSVSASCSVTVNPIEAASVTLSQSSVTLLLGQSATLNATVSPDNTTDKTVTWTSSNTAVATVNASGTIIAVGVGQATITATCGKVSATCAVTVKPIEAESVTLSQSELTLLPQQTAALKATVTPDNTTDKTVTWTSSDESVATVDASGNVTAIAVGTAQISATCGSASAACTVTVNPILAEGIILDQISLMLYIGDEQTLSATVLPENAEDKTVTWTSSDTSVATVDADGKVTATGAGQAVITAANGEAAATCQVTVNKYEQQIVWTQTFEDVAIDSVITLTAEATSGLQVAYTILEGSDLATLDGNTLHIAGAGTIELCASQDGDDKYLAAESVIRYIVVMAAGISELMADYDAVIEIYSANGTLAYRGKIADMNISLHGVYIILCNGKAIKAVF